MKIKLNCKPKQQNMTKLEKIRKQLDLLDDKIIKLLQKRAKLIIEVREVKKNEKLKIKDPQREQFILEKTQNNYEREVFKKILSESVKLQAKAPKRTLAKTR